MRWKEVLQQSKKTKYRLTSLLRIPKKPEHGQIGEGIPWLAAEFKVKETLEVDHKTPERREKGFGGKEEAEG